MLYRREERKEGSIQSEWRAEAKILLGLQIVETTWPDDVVRSCVNCLHFDENKITCNKYNVQPPPRIIAFGCKDYWDDRDIPF